MHMYLHLYILILWKVLLIIFFYSFSQLSALFSYMRNYVSIYIHMLNKFKEILAYAFVLKKDAHV